MVAWAVPAMLAAGTLIGELTKKKAKKRSTMDKGQKELWGQYGEGLQGRGPLADLYKFDPTKARENYMQNVGNPQYQSFQENVVPQITGAFRSKGLGNSSYAGQALVRGGRDVQNQINAGMNDYMYNQEQAINQRKQGAMENYMGTTTFNYQRPEESPLDSLIRGAGQGAGQYSANKLLGG